MREIVAAPDVIDDLVRTLVERGHRVLGPVVGGGAIVHDEIDGLVDLPAGWGDEQGPGTYRLRHRDDEAVFGHAAGPQSWKRWLLPPRTLAWAADRSEEGWEPRPTEGEGEPPLAFVGVRACDLAAIAIQDRVLLGGPFADTTYGRRRRDLVVVAVDCAEPAATCFCTSMGGGPAVESGADVVVTELVGDGLHEILLRATSPVGDDLLAGLDGEEPTAAHHAAAEGVRHRARQEASRRHLDTDDLPGVLRRQVDDAHWDDVARRCLACANCTLVCPTCFCTSFEDTTALDGSHAERWREWDSCFSGAYSHVAGHGPVRATTSARYRQWLTHKFSTWHDQFGTSGCVGCGRCIAWCPVGIDVTEELAVLRAREAADV